MRRKGLAGQTTIAPPSGPTLLARYVAFAVLASLVNLAVQRGVLAVWAVGALRYGAAMVAGVLASMAVRYPLDKIFIFADRSTGVAAHGRQVVLYGLMSVCSTAIFMAFETAFLLVGHTDAMRECGAVIGLAVSYAVKYNLDRRFVFNRAG